MSAKYSDILKAAREHIAARQQRFICLAIKFCSIGSELDKKCLRNWIEFDLLRGFFSYERWLRHHDIDLFLRMSEDDLRQARLQWLDWMIKHWEAKEAA